MGPNGCLWNSKHHDEFQVHWCMSPLAQLTLEQQKEIIEGEKESNQCAREVQEQVDGEEVLDPDITRSVLSTVLNTIYNQVEHECPDETVSLVNACLIRQSIDDQVPRNKYSIRGLPGTKFPGQQAWAVWFIVWRWVWDWDMPGALVADELGRWKTFTLVAAAVICKLLTEQVLVGLLPSILWGNTLNKWLNMAQNNYPGIFGEEWEWYLLLRLNSVPWNLLEIQSTPSLWHSVLTSAL